MSDSAKPQRFFEHMGIEFDRSDPDKTAIVVDVLPRHLNVNSVVHGSVIHALLDTAMGLECFRANERRPVATVEITVRYLQPVFDGRLEARANVVKRGRRVIAVEAAVTNGDATIATGQATFVPINRDAGSADADAG